MLENDTLLNELKPLINQAKLFAQKYDFVVTNECELLGLIA